MKLENHNVSVWSALLLALASLLVSTRTSYANVAAERINPAASEPRIDLNIFTADGKRMIGHARYTMSFAGDNETLRGESYFLDGEYDIEIELLRSVGQMPILITYEHSFFSTDHTLQRVVSFDSRSRGASCKTYRNGKLDEEHQSDLSIPSDTYAGAAQIMFIQAQLQKGRRDIRFHSFNCASEPKIIAAKAAVGSDRLKWPMYPGDLIRAEVEADLGWLDIFASPFLPKMYAWFDSVDNWRFVGGLIDRYYKGPRVLMVRIWPHT